MIPSNCGCYTCTQTKEYDHWVKKRQQLFTIHNGCSFYWWFNNAWKCNMLPYILCLCCHHNIFAILVNKMTASYIRCIYILTSLYHTFLGVTYTSWRSTNTNINKTSSCFALRFASKAFPPMNSKYYIFYIYLLFYTKSKIIRKCSK